MALAHFSDRATADCLADSRGHAALLGFGAFDEVGDRGEGGDGAFCWGIIACLTKSP